MYDGPVAFFKAEVLARISQKVCLSLSNRELFLFAIGNLKSAAQIHANFSEDIEYCQQGDWLKYILIHRPDKEVFDLTDFHAGTPFLQGINDTLQYLTELFASLLADSENIIIFKGDAINRGNGLVSAVMLLFLLFLQEALPGRFFYLIGNHELSWVYRNNATGGISDVKRGLDQPQLLNYLRGELQLTDQELIAVSNKVLAALVNFVVGPNWVATHSSIPRDIDAPATYANLYSSVWDRMVLDVSSGQYKINAAELADRAVRLVRTFFPIFDGPVYILRGHDPAVAAANPLVAHGGAVIVTTHTMMAEGTLFLLPTITMKTPEGVKLQICLSTVGRFMKHRGLGEMSEQSNIFGLIQKFNQTSSNAEYYLELFDKIGQAITEALEAETQSPSEAMEL